MNRGLSTLVFVVLGVAAGGVDVHGAKVRGHQRECSQEQRREWVTQALIKMQSIQPGMTREDLKQLFTTEGGLSNGMRRRYVSQECPYFKVDIEFRAVGRPERDEEGHVTLREDDRDVIVRISQPYLQFSVID